MCYTSNKIFVKTILASQSICNFIFVREFYKSKNRDLSLLLSTLEMPVFFINTRDQGHQVYVGKLKKLS